MIVWSLGKTLTFYFRNHLTISHRRQYKNLLDNDELIVYGITPLGHKYFFIAPRFLPVVAMEMSPPLKAILLTLELTSISPSNNFVENRFFTFLFSIQDAEDK